MQKELFPEGPSKVGVVSLVTSAERSSLFNAHQKIVESSIGLTNQDLPKKLFNVSLVLDNEFVNDEDSTEALARMEREISDYCAHLNGFINKYFAYAIITVSPSTSCQDDTKSINKYVDISINVAPLSYCIKLPDVSIVNIPLSRWKDTQVNSTYTNYTEALCCGFILIRDKYSDSIIHCRKRINDFIAILEAHRFYNEIDIIMHRETSDYSRSKFASPQINFGYPHGVIQPGFTPEDGKRLSGINPSYHDLRMRLNATKAVGDLKLVNRLELEIAILEDAFIKMFKKH